METTKNAPAKINFSSLENAILNREKVELEGIAKLYKTERFFIALEAIGTVLMLGSIAALFF